MSSPPRKKEDGVAEVSSDSSNSGVIRFEVDKVSTLDKVGRFSHEIEVGGVPWKANVFIDPDEQYLGVDICCLHKQTLEWCIDLSVKYTLFNTDNNKTHVKELQDDCFANMDGKFPGYELLVDSKTLMDENNGFIKDDKITAEFHFSITKMDNVKFLPRIDFTDSTDSRNDVALVINGEKIYVNKGILAFHSPVFKAMFYGGFDEQTKKEIELKDIDREAFLEMLHVIYPTNRLFTADSLEPILELADRFQMQCVLDCAEKCLAESDEFCITKKLRLADKYKLTGLLEEYISKNVSSRDALNELKESSIFGDLSDATKTVLFERAVDFINLPPATDS